MKCFLRGSYQENTISFYLKQFRLKHLKKIYNFNSVTYSAHGNLDYVSNQKIEPIIYIPKCLLMSVSHPCHVCGTFDPIDTFVTILMHLAFHCLCMNSL